MLTPHQPQTVLGLWDGHDAGAALVRDGVVVAAVSEERLTRVKSQGGFPDQALPSVLRLANVSVADVDTVAVAGVYGRLPARALNDRYSATAPQSVDQFSAASRLYAAYQNQVVHAPLVRDLERLGSRFVLGRRLAEHGLAAARLTLVDHHQAHAASALCTVDGQQSMVLTMDGYGDGVSTAVWLASRGTLRRVAIDGPRSSPALLYGAITQMLGFREGEEGKVTGLAAVHRGQPTRNPDIDLRPYIGAANGRLQLRSRAALTTLRTAYAAGHAMEEIALALQQPLEDAVFEVARHHLAATGARQLAVAGGLFGNVSINGRLATLDVDRFGVFPAMGDQGLCVGAALVASQRWSDEAMPSVYLGHGLGRTETDAPDPGPVAARLAAGEVVGVARGRMEFGPRALGARSILFDPRDVALARRVNEQLQRESFMPFAPLLHERHWDQAFAMARAPIARAAREMTLALPVREAFAAQAPGAVARDGTARPQVVSDRGDAWLAAVLLRFQALTGCPALINTSFNRHREPIICSAAEAIETARSVKLDALVIGAELIELSAARRVPQAAWA